MDHGARRRSQTTAISHRIERTSSTSGRPRAGPPRRPVAGGETSAFQCGLPRNVPVLQVDPAGGRAAADRAANPERLPCSARICRMSALYLLCLIMSRGFRDVVLVACALICAAAAIYVVYNIEVFKHKYELQILGQPEQQQ